ncbi:MAG: hypothetical protein AB1896_00745 [Thermodesulfobacteriota bacterium]
MLSRAERDRVFRQAYVPEHLPEYVAAVSGAEPFLHQDHLCFVSRSHLLFIGYPLGRPDADTAEAWASARRHFAPKTTALIAPEINLPPEEYGLEAQDHYYRLDLPAPRPGPKTANMVRRAGRELAVGPGRFGRDHRRLVKDFLSRRDLPQEQKRLFHRLDAYLKRSPTARLLEARKGRVLAAFNVLDLGSADFAFWLFSVRCLKLNVPGAVDLLMNEMAALALAEGKKAINLGLGLTGGTRRFKEKWGGRPFLAYASAIQKRSFFDPEALFRKL